MALFLQEQPANQHAKLFAPQVSGQRMDCLHAKIVLLALFRFQARPIANPAPAGRIRALLAMNVLHAIMVHTLTKMLLCASSARQALLDLSSSCLPARFAVQGHMQVLLVSRFA